MGEAEITDDPEGPPDPWPVEVIHPDFFVVDDQLTDYYHKVEVQSGARITVEVLQALWRFVQANAPWSVGLAGPSIMYVYVCRKGLFTFGVALRGATSLEEIETALSQDLGR